MRCVPQNNGTVWLHPSKEESEPRGILLRVDYRKTHSRGLPNVHSRDYMYLERRPGEQVLYFFYPYLFWVPSARCTTRGPRLRGGHDCGFYGSPSRKLVGYNQSLGLCEVR